MVGNVLGHVGGGKGEKEGNKVEGMRGATRLQSHGNVFQGGTSKNSLEEG